MKLVFRLSRIRYKMAAELVSKERKRYRTYTTVHFHCNSTITQLWLKLSEQYWCRSEHENVGLGWCIERNQARYKLQWSYTDGFRIRTAPDTKSTSVGQYHAVFDWSGQQFGFATDLGSFQKCLDSFCKTLAVGRIKLPTKALIKRPTLN